MSCDGCTQNREKQQVIDKAKADAKKFNKTYAIYYEAGGWYYIDITIATGIPYTMVVSDLTP